MALQRRELIQLVAAGSLTGLAGCQDLFSIGQGTDNGEWPQFRGGPELGGTRPQEAGPGEELTEAWAWTEDDVKEPIAETSERVDAVGDVVLVASSSPVVLDGTVVVEVQYDIRGYRALVALDGESGNPEWTYAFDGVEGGTRPSPLPLSPVLRDGQVLHTVPDGDEAKLVALDLETGEAEWTDRIHAGTPVLRDDTLYVVGHDTITAFDLENAEREWEWTDVSLTNHRATVTESAILAMDGVEVVAHDREGGEERWRAELADPEWPDHDRQVFTAPVIDEERVFAGRSKQLLPVLDLVGMVSFDVDDGEVRWGFGPPFGATGSDGEARGAVLGYPVVAEGLVFATVKGTELVEAAGADPDRAHLFAFDAKTGEIEWTVPARRANAPVIAGDIVYIVGYPQIVAISTDGNPVDQTSLDVRTYSFGGSPALADGYLYAPVARGGVVAFGG